MAFDPIVWAKIKALQADIANLVNGVIPEGYIPSQVIERATKSAFDEFGKSEVLYIAADTNLVYRWNGSTYVLLGLNTSGKDYTAGDGITISSDNEISVNEELLSTIAALQATIKNLTPSGSGKTPEEILTDALTDATTAKTTAEAAKTLAEDTAVWTKF